MSQSNKDRCFLCAVFSLVLLVAFVTILPAQQNRYSLTGQLFFDNEAPVVGAVITLANTNLREMAGPVLTDREGRFTIGGVSEGSYVFYAERKDLGRMLLGESPQGDTAAGLTLNDHSPTGEMLFHIDRPGVIVGTVRDRMGNPMARQSLNADRRSWGEGKAVIKRSARTAVTDEDGHFRIPLLRPGRYRVCAEHSPDEQLLPVSKTFYGRKPEEQYIRSCLPNSDKSFLLVGPGEKVEADILLNQWTPVEVSGTIVNPLEGQEPTVLLMSADSSETRFALIKQALGNAHEFRISGVAPGQYWLTGGVVPKSPEDGWLSARISVTVGDSGLSGLKLTLAASPIINVVVHAPKDAGEITIGVLEADRSLNSVTNAVRQADGSLRIVLGHEGRYWLVTREDFCPASAQFGELNVLNQAFTIAPGAKENLEVTITDQCGEIGGLAIDRIGKPVPNARVLILISGTAKDPGDSMLVNTADDGTFSYTGLTPGKYALWTWKEADEWRGALANLAELQDQQMQVDVKAGGRSNVNVKLVDFPDQERKK